MSPCRPRFARSFARSFALAVAVAIAAGVPMSGHAASVRVGNQGDALSMDPHSLNEAVQLGFLNNVFESLVTRDKTLALAPSLATAWRAVQPTVWEFELRRNVRFHDGAPFSAADVLFSLQRARGDGSDVKSQLASIKDVRQTGEFTVQIETSAPNPILPDLLTNIMVMNRAWCETNGALQPVDRRKGIENPASFRANGTGPFRVRERQPGIRTVLSRHAQWWNRAEGNVDEVIFMPVTNDATRVAALVAGDLDVIDPLPLQDTQRIRAVPTLKVQEGPESRVIFLGFDHKRDELPGSSVKGKNPFKDLRVRQAVYQAIDIETIKARVMRGAALPTGSMVARGIRGHAPEMEKRLPYDPEAAKKLLADAGYAAGFDVTMQCPNDRYVNDSEICQAVAANLARVGINVKLQAEGKATYFPKALRREVGFFMLGWSPAGYDAHNILFTVLATPAGAQGQWNFGAYSNAQLDALTTKIQSETDEPTRNRMIRDALALHAADIGHVPLHQQMLGWAMKRHIDAFQRPDGFMLFKWMTVGKP
jgi:peptide/nickel transport system substrate-binding protein